MRIAMVSEHANPLADVGSVDAGGQNVHVAALAKGLAARGHDVTVFTRRDDPSPPRRLASPDGYVVELVPAGPPTDIPKDELLRHMPAFAAYLRDSWLTEQYDLAHSHFWMSGMAATRAAQAAQVPVVHTFHALGTVKRRQQGRRDTSPPERIDIEARLCRAVERVIATCRDELRELAAMGMDRDQASIVPCGVDVESFVPSPRQPSGGPRLLVLGRLVERKGVGNVITALGRLPGVHLVIAGGPARDALSADPEVCRLRELAHDAGCSDRVEFVGRVHRADVPALISSVDVVVAVPWYEPFGIVPLEAMACGRPVVGSAVGGLLDTIVAGRTGELIPPRRPDILARTLRDLLADPDRQAEYGRAGYERAVSIYRWEQVAASTEAVYRAVLARQPLQAAELLR